MRSRRSSSLAMLIVLTCVGASTAQSTEVPADTTPTDVYHEVEAVAGVVEQLRRYMGRPVNMQPPIDVSGVAPREVIYQANTLCEKVNRLGFERIREVSEKPAVPNREIVPADVLRMVRVAHGQVRRIADQLDVEPAPPGPASTESRTPTDVYKAIVQLNRQVNLLLDEHFSPSDVYEEVSLAIAYAAGLRRRWPGDRIPPEPDWEFGKRPTDVIVRLAQCLKLVRSIAEHEDLEVLQLHLDESNLDSVSPSDVYDIAALLVSELAYLDRTLADAATERKARYPGRKVPSDVYQRAGMLLQQLEEIDDLISTNSAQGGS